MSFLNNIKNKLISFLGINTQKTYDYYHQNTFWNDHILIREYQNKLATGKSDEYWMKHLYRLHFKNKTNIKVLSIVCGNGWQDRLLDKIFNFKRLDGYDISKSLLKIAKTEANNNKYHYHYGDLNKDIIKYRNYDLAVNLAGLHHIENMDHVVSQVHKSLKPGGIFVHYEYIGPKRNQYSNHSLKYMNIMQKKFPKNLVGRTPITRPDENIMLQEDPSEAIGSELIIPTLKKYFKISRLRYLNGGMLYQVLYNQIQNFDRDNLKHNKLLKKNIQYEIELTKRGIVKPLFAYIICKK